MKNAQEAQRTGHFTRVKEVEGAARPGGGRAKGWDIYIDDRVRPDGHAYPAEPTRGDKIIGYLRSPKGFLAERPIANSIQALDAELALWADDGLPGNHPLVRKWTKAEEKIFESAQLAFRLEWDMNI